MLFRYKLSWKARNVSSNGDTYYTGNSLTDRSKLFLYDYYNSKIQHMDLVLSIGLTVKGYEIKLERLGFFAKVLKHRTKGEMKSKPKPLLYYDPWRSYKNDS